VKTGTNERRDIEDTGRSSGCGFQHICIISCSNGGQPSGIVGVKFLSRINAPISSGSTETCGSRCETISYTFVIEHTNELVRNSLFE
jgi:hypothetical protein